MPASKTNPKVHGKRYGVIQKLGVKALVNAGLTDAQIAAENNVSTQTVWRIKNNKELKELDAEQVLAIKEGLQKLSYKRSFQALENIDAEKFRKASLVQTMVSAKIGLEMGRLMEGLSTENIKIEEDTAIESELKAKMDELERIRSAKVIDVSTQ